MELALANYIRDARKSGLSDEQIRISLGTGGWEAGEIESAFAQIGFRLPRTWEEHRHIEKLVSSIGTPGGYQREDDQERLFRLADYVRDARAIGLSDQQIKLNLQDGGWGAKDVEGVFYYTKNSGEEELIRCGDERDLELFLKRIQTVDYEVNVKARKRVFLHIWRRSAMHIPRLELLGYLLSADESCNVSISDGEIGVARIDNQWLRTLAMEEFDRRGMSNKANDALRASKAPETLSAFLVQTGVDSQDERWEIVRRYFQMKPSRFQAMEKQLGICNENSKNWSQYLASFR